MRLILWLPAALIGIWLVFILGPAVVMFRIAFGRPYAPSYAELAQKDAAYRPYLKTAEENTAYLRALPKQEVSLQSSDGVRLTADYYDAGSSTVIAFFHGYHASAESNFFVQARLAREQGWNLLLADQRGHGRSGGKTGMGLSEQEDVLAWVRYLQALPGVRQVILYGVSMGAAAIAYASDRLDPAFVKGMVLDCGFSSPYVQIRREGVVRRLPVVLLLPVIEFLAARFRGISIRTEAEVSLRRTRIPALFLHGGKDNTVPPEHGKQAYDACASRKEWLPVPSAAHTLAVPAGGEAAKERLLAFWSSCINSENSIISEQEREI